MAATAGPCSPGPASRGCKRWRHGPPPAGGYRSWQRPRERAWRPCPPPSARRDRERQRYRLWNRESRLCPYSRCAGRRDTAKSASARWSRRSRQRSGYKEPTCRNRLLPAADGRESHGPRSTRSYRPSPPDDTRAAPWQKKSNAPMCALESGYHLARADSGPSA